MESTAKLVVHGTGNAWPEICRDLACPLCHGSDRPLAGRGNTALSLVYDNLHLVVDAGAGCHAGIRRANLASPNIILITHSHPDHLNEMELNTLIRDVQIGGFAKPILVATERTWQDISSFHQKRLEFASIAPG